MMKKLEIDKHCPYISIIIPTYNESKYVRRCLESLERMDYSKEQYEVIIVDNGSTDETVNICKEFAKQVFICPSLTVAGLRNYGAKKANGEIYAFIDADCVADRDWLKNAAAALSIESCVTGSKYCIPPDAVWIERAWFAQRPKGTSEVAYINSGNMLMPAAIFKKIGGFNEQLTTGEDYELCLRARKITNIISNEDIRVMHLGNPKTLRSFFKREVWHGLGAIESFKQKLTDLPFIGTVIFFLLTLFQIIGIARLVSIGSGDIAIFATTGVAILLSATVLYRIKCLSSLIHGFQLMALYYVYYVGRLTALFYIISGKKYLRIK